MQVQYYHPVGPHLLYHYAAPNPAAAHLPPPPPPPHPYYAFPLILSPQPQQQQQQQQPPPQLQQRQHQPQPSPALITSAAAFFAAQQQQQQQLACLALHFQSLGVGSGGGCRGCGSSSSGSSNSGGGSSPYDAAIDRVRCASLSQADYNWKLLTWLKTHRMHKYFDRLRKYTFDQLLSLDRDTLAAEQFTQGAIKKLLGMLERVRLDRSAFESPTRSSGSPPAQPPPPPPPPSQPPQSQPRHYQLRAGNSQLPRNQHIQQQRYLPSQN